VSVDDPTKLPTGLPDLKAAAKEFSDFVTTIAWLRDKEQGCPWDLEQDHKSLRRYMIEEAYEAAEAMSGTDLNDIRDELGDVLLQVILNAQIASDNAGFSIVDVIRSINQKMLRRHPHVFSPDKDSITTEQVRGNWEKIKAEEKLTRATAPEAVFAGSEKKQPASLQALHIGKVAAKINFDWDTPAEVFAQLKSEIAEVEKEMQARKVDPAKVSEEIGDVFFSLGQLCRHLKLDPETVAMDGNRKFLRRFSSLESIAAAEGVDVKKAARDDLEKLWMRAKNSEKKK
jgi:nucleoside triphosphate diphosphatase